MDTAHKDFSSFLPPLCIMSSTYTAFFQNSMTSWRCKCAKAILHCRHQAFLKIVLIMEKG